MSRLKESGLGKRGTENDIGKRNSRTAPFTLRRVRHPPPEVRNTEAVKQRVRHPPKLPAFTSLSL